MAIKDWITNYPTSLDTDAPGNMEDLVDGADLSRVSQIHSIRDALIAIETEIGTTVPAVGSLRKRVADLEGLVGTDEDAIHDNVADEIHQIALKGTPAGSDVFIIEDGTDSWNKKRITLTSLPGNTLDQAYDEGGAGAGRLITVDSGAVELTVSSDQDGIVISGGTGYVGGTTNYSLLTVTAEATSEQATGAAYFELDTAGVTHGTLTATSKSATTPLGANKKGIPFYAYVFPNNSDDALGEWIGYRAQRISGASSSASMIAFEAASDTSGNGFDIALRADKGSVVLQDGYISLGEQSGDPTAHTDFGVVYTKDDSGDSEIFYRNPSHIIQMTKDGYMNVSLGSAYDVEQGSQRTVNVDDEGITFSINNPGAWDNGIYVVNLQATTGVQNLFTVWHEGDPATADIYSSYFGVQPYGADNAAAVWVDLWFDEADGSDVLTSGEKATGAFYNVKNHSGHDAASNVYGTRYGLAADGAAKTTALLVYKRAGTTDEWDVAFENTSGDIIFDGGPVRLGEQTSDPTNVANKGFLYCKDDGGITELFYSDDAGTITQITADGYLNTFESLKGVGLYEQSADPTAKPDKGFVYTKDDGGDTELFYRDDSARTVQITKDGYVNGNTLDQAYDAGGAGAGRTVEADSGWIEINASGTSVYGLVINSEGNIGSLWMGNFNLGNLRPVLDVLATADDNSVRASKTQLSVSGAQNLCAANVAVIRSSSGMNSGTANTAMDCRVVPHTGDNAASELIALALNDAANAPGAYPAQQIGVDVKSNYSPFDIAWRNDSGDIQFDGGPIRLGEQSSDPSNVANKGFLYAKDESGITELFYSDDAGTVTQITADGYLNTAESLKGVGLYERFADPTAKSDKGFVYTKDDGGDTELFYMDDSGNIVQLTQDGSVAGGGGGNYNEEEKDLTGAETPNSTQTKTLTNTPITSINAPSGYAIMVYRNGQKMRYNSSPSTYLQFNYNSGLNRIEFLANGSADQYEIVYWS